MQPPVSLPPTDDVYRMADLALFAAGENTVLAYSRATQQVQTLRTDIVDLLAQCREFKTLDEHIQSYCRGRQASLATMRSMRRSLQQLAEQGFLVSRRSSLEQLHEPPAPLIPSRIASIGFPTCGRVATLQRGMTSFLEHCRRFGRSHDLVVVDDSRDPDTQRAYREMLAQLQDEYGFACAYAGPEEKQAFAERLASAGDLPLDVVQFVCVGSPEYGVTTVGANRNALLLHTIGDIIFSADDDIICRPAIAPDLRPGLRLHSRRNPLDVWVFPNREAAIVAAERADDDILALHEQWIGADIQSCLAQSAGDPLAIDESDPRFLRRLEQRSGRIGLTLNGSLGDCSWDNPHFFLFQRGTTFQRLTQSEQTYEAARGSREMVQAVTQVTLAEHADPMFAMCMGLDNRELLPPFTPLGRAEEVGFGALLSRCFDRRYALHLPWTLLHAPTDARGFSAQAMFSLGLGNLIPSLVNQFDPGFAQSAVDRLDKLGRHIEEMGRLPQHSFAEYMRLHIMENMSALIASLEERLHAREAPPAFWVQHARSVIAQAREHAVAPVEQLYTLPGGHEGMQRLLLRYGQSLQWWPAIVEAARSLRAQEQRLAQPV
ncbi:MAG TPA: hypothetical protein VGD58_26800 [Herpetosiphonaceae bacterium]